MMRHVTIAIDARPLARKMNGIRRYTEELLKILVRDKSIRWLLYTDREIKDTPGLLEQDNVDIHVVPFGGVAKLLWPWYSLVWLYRHKPDIYWSPRHHLPISAPEKTHLFLTIHDLVWMESRGTMPLMAYASEKVWTRRSINKANTILTVSNTTSKKMKQHFKSCKAPIFTITNGYNPPERASQPEALRSFPVGDYFLAVGTFEPRKNYANLIAGYHDYVDSGGKKALLIAGNKGWAMDMNKLVQPSARAENKVLILEGISDCELRWCYEHASALVSASLYEGFGIPLVEAQYFGVPLIVSDIEPYREISGPGTVFFNPKNKADISRALLNSEPSTGKSGSGPGSREFSWEASARELADLFVDSMQIQATSSDEN